MTSKTIIYLIFLIVTFEFAFLFNLRDIEDKYHEESFDSLENINNFDENYKSLQKVSNDIEESETQYKLDKVDFNENALLSRLKLYENNRKEELSNEHEYENESEIADLDNNYNKFHSEEKQKYNYNEIHKLYQASSKFSTEKYIKNKEKIVKNLITDKSKVHYNGIINIIIYYINNFIIKKIGFKKIISKSAILFGTVAMVKPIKINRNYSSDI